MRRSVAAVGSAAFFVVGPGTVAGLVPWLISGWRIAGPGPLWAAVPVRVVGVVLIAVAAAVLVRAFAGFVTEGRGTPVPAAPPDRLVVGGLFRYVRNPMYVALIAATRARPCCSGSSASSGTAWRSRCCRWPSFTGTRSRSCAGHSAPTTTSTAPMSPAGGRACARGGRATTEPRRRMS